jgi:hypothetical protein
MPPASRAPATTASASPRCWRWKMLPAATDAACWRLRFLAVRSAAEAGRDAGSFQIVEGSVVDAVLVEGTLYLNFARDWRHGFSRRPAAAPADCFAMPAAIHGGWLGPDCGCAALSRAASVRRSTRPTSSGRAPGPLSGTLVLSAG